MGGCGRGEPRGRRRWAQRPRPETQGGGKVGVEAGWEESLFPSLVLSLDLPKPMQGHCFCGGCADPGGEARMQVLASKIQSGHLGCI